MACITLSLYMPTTFYAHTYPGSGNDTSRWEPLFTPGCRALHENPCPDCERLAPNHGHLNKVAWLAAKFAGEMFASGSDAAQTASQLGYLAGQWHDLGNFSLDFRKKLLGERVQVEYAGAGAALARERIKQGWEVLAFVIAGHHSGLPNACVRESADKLTVLDERLERATTVLMNCRHAVEEKENTSRCVFQAFLNPPQLPWTVGAIQGPQTRCQGPRASYARPEF